MEDVGRSDGDTYRDLQKGDHVEYGTEVSVGKGSWVRDNTTELTGSNVTGQGGAIWYYDSSDTGRVYC